MTVSSWTRMVCVASAGRRRAGTIEVVTGREMAVRIRRMSTGELAPLIVNPAAVDLHAVHEAFLRHTLTLRQVDSWQQAWQSFTEPGFIRITPARCAGCHGRRYDHRSMARTGSVICHLCRGTGRGSLTTVRTRPVPLP